MSASARQAPWQVPAMAALLALQLAIVVPATIYLSNLTEFFSAPPEIFRLLTIPALALTALLALLGLVAGPAWRSRLVTLLAALTLLVWVQAFILVWDYGPLDGSQVDWRRAPWRGLDLLLWIGGVVAALALERRVRPALVAAAVVVTVLQCAVLVTTGMQQRQGLAALTDKARPRTASDSLPEMARFSSQRNVLHLILDSFQSDIFREIVSEGPVAERYRAALDGFTFYERNVGVFPYTYFSLPAILSGRLYRNDVPKQQFIETTFAGPTLLNAAHAAGYEVDIATEALMLNMMMHGRYTNAYHVPDIAAAGVSPVVRDLVTLLDLGLFRVAPHLLKPYVYNDQRWLLPRPNAGEDAAFRSSFYFAHNAFLARLTRDLRADRTAPVYKFFHIMSAHAPMVANPGCGFAGRTLPRVRETVVVQSRCTLEFTIALLERMKAAGLYDDALIVLMGDHGGHIPPTPYRAATDHAAHPWLVAMATPLLLIKPPKASGPLRFSTAPTSVLDVAPTLDAMLGLGAGFAGTPVGQLGDGPRQRPFHMYEWRRADYVSDYILPIDEYRVPEDPYDADLWVPVRRFAPPDGTGQADRPDP